LEKIFSELANSEQPVTTEYLSAMKKWDPKKRVIITTIKGVKKKTYEVYAYLPNGMRKRQRFDDLIKAQGYADDLVQQGLNLIPKKEVRVTDLTKQQEIDALHALEILKDHFGDRWSLARAANWAVKSYTEKDWTDVKVFDAIEKFFAWKKKEGAKENYLNKYRWRLGYLRTKDGKAYAKPGSFAALDKNLDDVTLDELDRFIWDESWDVSNSTRRDSWKHLSHFYDWAANRNPKKCSHNPVLDIAKPPANELDPEAFTVEQAENILKAATNCFNGELVPYFALALFGGLRPQEITGNENIKPLTWSTDNKNGNFRWDKDAKGNEVVSIRLRGKKAWRRTVTLPENCVAWIKPYAKKTGLVCPDNHLKKFDVVRCAAGFRISKARLYSIDKDGIDGLENPDSKDRPVWIQDGCRHSALSYKLAIVENIPAVCMWAGNSPRTFKANYESLVTRIDAEKYWDIFPSS